MCYFADVVLNLEKFFIVKSGKNIYYFCGIGATRAKHIWCSRDGILFCGTGTLAFDYFVVHFLLFSAAGLPI